MMVVGVAIERAHQPVDASGVLANDLHPARAREMARAPVPHAPRRATRARPARAARRSRTRRRANPRRAQPPTPRRARSRWKLKSALRSQIAHGGVGVEIMDHRLARYLPPAPAGTARKRAARPRPDWKESRTRPAPPASARRPARKTARASLRARSPAAPSDALSSAAVSASIIEASATDSLALYCWRISLRM